jgi:hypothetical protein
MFEMKSRALTFAKVTPIFVGFMPNKNLESKLLFWSNLVGETTAV